MALVWVMALEEAMGYPLKATRLARSGRRSSEKGSVLETVGTSERG